MELSIKNSIKYVGRASIQCIDERGKISNIFRRHNNGDTELSKLFSYSLNNQAVNVKPSMIDLVNEKNISLLKHKIYVQSINPAFEDDYECYSAELKFTIQSTDVISLYLSEEVTFVLYSQDNQVLANIKSNMQLRDLMRTGTSILVNWHLFVSQESVEETYVNYRAMSYVFMNALLGMDQYNFKPYKLNISINNTSIINEPILLTGFYVYQDSLENYYLSFNSLFTNKDINDSYLNDNRTVNLKIMNKLSDSEYNVLVDYPIGKTIKELLYKDGDLQDIIINWEIGLATSMKYSYGDKSEIV